MVEGLLHDSSVDLLALDQRARESVAVEEREEGDDHLTHRKQAVVARVEDTHDRQRYAPRDDLRDELAARTPGHRRTDGLGQAQRMLAL